ncbi:MAG: phage tail tape measure protein [Lachnospiraceae bacterium]|nr:phage tail tape measure protein [Lachnospiraceae bacterium]
MKLLTEECKGSANTQEALQKKVNKLTEAKAAQVKVIEDLEQGLANAKKMQETYAQKTSEMDRKISEANLRLKELSNTTGDTTEEQEELTRAIAQYTEELNTNRDLQKMAGESAESWKGKLTNAETALNKLDLELLKQEKYLDEAKKSSDGCATSINAFGKEVRSASGDNEKLNNTLTRSAEAMDALAVTLISSGVKETLNETKEVLLDCADAAGGFETAIKKVETIADSSEKSIGTIKEEILEYSSDLAVAAEDMSEATYSAISAGVKTAEAAKFAGTSTKLAIGGFTDTSIAVDVLTTALNAYKMKTEEAEKVSDYLITTQNLGKTTVGELASNMGRVIPVAAAYNVQMDNLSTAYAVMTANGIATAETTTYIKSMMGELGDSGSEVSKTLRNQTGRSFAELTAQGYSLGDIMAILGESVDDDAGKFNELWSSAEAGIGALSLLSAGSEKYNSVLSQMQQSAGATDAAFNLMADTQDMAKQRMLVSIDNMKIAIGDSLNPALRDLYENGGDAFEWAAEFIQQHPEVVQGITAITAGVAVLTTGLLAVHGATLAINAAMAMNPTTLMVVGLTAAAAAVGVFASALSAANKEQNEAVKKAQEFTKEVEALDEEIRESAESYDEQRKAISETAKENGELIRQLQSLAQINGKTKADHEAIQSVVNRLNEAIPELALAYDQQTGALNMTEEALRQAAEAYEEQEEYQALVERQTQLLEENREKSEELASARALLADAESALKETQTENNEETYAGILAIQQAEAQADLYKSAVEAASEALRNNVSEYNSVNAEINAYAAAHSGALPQTQQAIETLLQEAEATAQDQAEYQRLVEQIHEMSQAHSDYAAECQANIEIIEAHMEELQAAYTESYEAAMENISKQIGLFDEMDGKATQSIQDLIGSLQSQTEYMNEYAANITKAMEMGVDRGIIEKLSDGSEESARYLAAIVEAGEDEISALNEEFARVQEGKTTFSDAVAKMTTDFDAKMDAMSTAYDAMVRNLDDFDAAYAAAVNTCRGVERGVDARWGRVVGKYRDLANAAMAEFNRALDIHSPSRKFEWSAKMTMEAVEIGAEKKLPDVERSYREAAAAAYRAYEQQSTEVFSRTDTMEQNAIINMSVPTPDLVEMALRERSTRQQDTWQRMVDKQSEKSVVYLTNYTVLDGRVVGKETTKRVVSRITREQADRAVATGGENIVYGSV